MQKKLSSETKKKKNVVQYARMRPLSTVLVIPTSTIAVIVNTNVFLGSAVISATMGKDPVKMLRIVGSLFCNTPQDYNIMASKTLLRKRVLITI